MKTITNFISERLKLNANSKIREDKIIIIEPWNDDADLIANIMYIDNNMYLNKKLEIYDALSKRNNLYLFIMSYDDYLVIKDKLNDPKTKIYTYTETKLSIPQLANSFEEGVMSIKDLEKIN